jgi:hypothetical protein
MSSIQDDILDRLYSHELTIETLMTKLDQLTVQNIDLTKRLVMLENNKQSNTDDISKFISDYESKQDELMTKGWNFLIDNTFFKAVVYALTTSILILFVYLISSDPNTRNASGANGFITVTNFPVVLLSVLLTVGLNFVLNSLVTKVQKRIKETEKVNTIEVKDMCKSLISEIQTEIRDSERKDFETRVAYEKEEKAARVAYEKEEKAARVAYEEKQVIIFDNLLSKINQIK